MTNQLLGEKKPRMRGLNSAHNNHTSAPSSTPIARLATVAHAIVSMLPAHRLIAEGSTYAPATAGVIVGDGDMDEAVDNVEALMGMGVVLGGKVEVLAEEEVIDTATPLDLVAPASPVVREPIDVVEFASDADARANEQAETVPMTTCGGSTGPVDAAASNEAREVVNHG